MELIMCLREEKWSPVLDMMTLSDQKDAVICVLK